MKHLFLIIVSSFLFSHSIYSQGNGTCANAQPFCTGSTVNYPAGVNTGNAQAGPNYGCLGSQPNPAWFSLQILTAGPISIVMSAANDIDFIAYGPFPSLTGNCGNLTAGTTVPNTGGNNGCSYSGSATETLVIANALPGQNYLLLITNFSNANQPITFNQNNSNVAGAGTTNCGILCTFTAAATVSLCSTQTATFGVTTTTNITSVSWQGPNGFSAATGNTSLPNIAVAASGVYTCIATTTGTNPATNTCAVTKTITVVPTPTPIVTSTTVCANATANISVAGGSATSTYAWSGPSGFASNLVAPSIPNAQLPNSGVYTVLVSTAGCTATANGTVLVNANPVVTATSSGNYCFAQSFTLSANGSTSYSWVGPNAFASNAQNPVLTNNALANSGTYTVLGTTNGCTATVTTPVTINALPNITATSSGNVCQNQLVTLTAGGGVTYVWAGPINYSSNQAVNTFPSAQMNLNGNYTVTGTDANGCVNTATLNQIVFALPTPIAFGSNACLNDYLTLNVNQALSYQWMGPNGFTSTQQNPTINGVNFNSAGIYSVVVTAAGGCTASAVTAYCDVYPAPTVGFTGTTEVCRGGTFNFSGTGALNYKWLTMFGVLSLQDTYSISTISPNIQTSYTLVGADANGCIAKVVISPIVLPLPSAFVTPQKTGGCAPFCTTFNLTKSSTNITSVDWNFSNGNSYIDSAKVKQCFNIAGTQTVAINLIDARGCKSAISNSIEVYPIPQADFEYSPDAPNDNDFVVSFTDITKAATVQNWFWDFYSNGIDTSIKQNPTYNFPNVGNYFVYLKVKSNHGCVDSIIKKLTVVEDVTFFVPNSFTPNGDGSNDVFTPKAVGVKKYHMDIFDRWGQILYSTSDIEKGWDGKSKKGGDTVPQDVYVYKISVIQNTGKPKQYVGHVTLIR